MSALLGHGWFSFLRLTSGLWIEADGKKLVCSSFCGQFLTLKDDFRNLLADRFFFILSIPSRCFEKLGDTELLWLWVMKFRISDIRTIVESTFFQRPDLVFIHSLCINRSLVRFPNSLLESRDALKKTNKGKETTLAGRVDRALGNHISTYRRELTTNTGIGYGPDAKTFTT